MANGDMLSADWQFQLHNTLYGNGLLGVTLDLQTAIAGIGNPDAKTQDVAYNFADGSYANPDYTPLRTITIPVILRGGASTAPLTALKNIQAAWSPVTADTDLAFQLVGGFKFYVNGRPRGLKDDLSLMQFGAVRALLRFDCPDPTIHYI